MLTAALATHPKTAPAVLDVLATASDPYTAAVARHRTGHPDPWDVPNLDRLGDGDLRTLLTFPGAPPAQRHALITLYPGRWVPDLTGGYLTGTDLHDIATVVLNNFDTYADTRLPISLATDPRLHASTAQRLLDAIQAASNATLPVTPAIAVAVADNHQLDPALLPFDQHSRRYTREGAVRDALDAYQAKGRDLAALLADAPWRAVAGPDHGPFTLHDIAPHTSNETVVNHIADQVLGGNNGLDQLAAEHVLRQLLRNHNLPTLTRTQLAHRTLDRAAVLSSITVRAAASALVGAAAPHDAHVIAHAIHYIPEHNLPLDALNHPRLTAPHLRALTAVLPTLNTLDPHEEASLAARIAAHPATDPATRTLARTHINPDILQRESRPGMLALALNLPLSTADFPTEPDADDRALFEPALSEFINRHPHLLINPDLVRTVLALTESFTGPLDELVNTAVGITQPAPTA